MPTNTFVLADGIPPGAIFGGIVFVLWIVTAIFGKAKTPEVKKPTPTMTDLAEIRRRVLEEQAKGKQEAQQQVVAMRQKARKKSQRKGTPPPLPPVMTPPTQRQPAPASLPASIVTPGVSVPLTAHRVGRSETAKNVRVMLLRNGVAEAFVLGEIFGRPKGLE